MRASLALLALACIAGADTLALKDGRFFEGKPIEATDEGFRDVETGSLGRVDGRASEGPLAGRHLEPIADAYVAFWFAWAAFQPETVVWGG